MICEAEDCIHNRVGTCNLDEYKIKIGYNGECDNYDPVADEYKTFLMGEETRLRTWNNEVCKL